MDELHARILNFEQKHQSRRPTPAEIRREFNLAHIRYTQILYRLIDTEEAEKLDPILTHRLRRMRDNQSRN